MYLMYLNKCLGKVRATSIFDALEELGLDGSQEKLSSLCDKEYVKIQDDIFTIDYPHMYLVSTDAEKRLAEIARRIANVTNDECPFGAKNCHTCMYYRYRDRAGWLDYEYCTNFVDSKYLQG